MKRENTEEFISDAIDIGFKVIDNNERISYSEVELMYMEKNKKEKYLSEIEKEPSTILFNPDNNVIIEVFESNDEIVEANAIFKYSALSLKDDIISMRFLEVGETVLDDKNFNGLNCSHLMKIKLEDIGDACDIESILNHSSVFKENIEFKDEQIKAFTFMQDFQGGQREKVEKLNQIFGDNIENIIQSPKGFNLRKKVKI